MVRLSHQYLVFRNIDVNVLSKLGELFSSQKVPLRFLGNVLSHVDVSPKLTETCGQFWRSRRLRLLLWTSGNWSERL